MSQLYIGLMSGTSLDGIDAALVNLADNQFQLIDSYYEEYTPALREQILALCLPGDNEINRMAELDVTLGKQFSKAALALLHKNHLTAQQVTAIGSHGQTIRHLPQQSFTLQIGDPNIIAAETKITTVADFRRRDIALGGQGAPLVPGFHQAAFAKKGLNRIILNLGGIANITLLPAAQDSVLGFDTGPGNTLLDAWINHHQQQTCDKNGTWARSGKLNAQLLEVFLRDPFFKLLPPKSTGREYFNLAWLNQYLPATYQPADVQATLLELTATSVMNAINLCLPHGEILVCGGGVHNDFLIERLKALAKNHTVASTSILGINPDMVEATAFAWLAKQTLLKQTGNLMEVTGASQKTILGGVYFS